MQAERNFFHKIICSLNSHSWAMFPRWKLIRPESVQAIRSVYLDINPIPMLHMTLFNGGKGSGIYSISLGS